jgi:hypothetical protein
MGEKERGACRGDTPFTFQHRRAPRDVALGGAVEEDFSIQEIPKRLDEIIDYLYPDALMVGATRHSDDVYSIYVLDIDYKYTKWLASLSLDQRWTLSPRDNAWHSEGSSPHLEGI